MTLYLGKVSCDLQKFVSRVRVTITGAVHGHLSVKADLNDFSQTLFVEGRIVEVERCGAAQERVSGVGFRVIRVFDELEKEEYVSPGGNPCSEVSLKEEEVCIMSTNTMSHDRIRFFISSSSYYNTQRQRDCLRSVLEKAFDMSPCLSEKYMAQNYGGFFVVCRPSQFARFMIFRDAAGLKNGFIDLQANLYVPEPPKDIYTILAEKAGITRDQAKRGALALGFSGRRALEERMGGGACSDGVPEIDVSRNKYEPR